MHFGGAKMTEEIKREYDNWLLAINRDFPNKGFEVEITVKNGFEIRFTPRHTTPTIFCKTEGQVKSILANMHMTLGVLQSVKNDKSRCLSQGVA
jgi:hypothetical protein